MGVWERENASFIVNDAMSPGGVQALSDLNVFSCLSSCYCLHTSIYMYTCTVQLTRNLNASKKNFASE